MPRCEKRKRRAKARAVEGALDVTMVAPTAAVIPFAPLLTDPVNPSPQAAPCVYESINGPPPTEAEMRAADAEEPAGQLWDENKQLREQIVEYQELLGHYEEAVRSMKQQLSNIKDNQGLPDCYGIPAARHTLTAMKRVNAIPTRLEKIYADISEPSDYLSSSETDYSSSPERD